MSKLYLMTLLISTSITIVQNNQDYNSKFLYFIIIIILLIISIFLINKWFIKRFLAKSQHKKFLLEEKVFKLNRELHESEAKLTSILVSLHESMVVVIDPNGIYLNIWEPPELEKRYRLRCEDLVGMSVTSQFPPPETKAFLSLIQIVYSQGKPQKDRYIFKCPGGEFWHDISLSPMRNANGDIIAVVGFIRDITEQKQALLRIKKSEEKFQESEEKYRSLIEHSNDAIYVLAQPKFVIINKKFEEMFGYTQAETNAADFDFMDLVAPNSKAYVAKRAYKLTLGEELDLPLRYEFTALTRDGREIEAEVSVTYINYEGKKATQGILRDITDRKRAEEREKFITNLLQASKVAIIGTDTNRRFIIWNRGAEELFGWKADEILGKPGSIIVPLEYLQEIDQIIKEKLLNGEGTEFETVRLCKDGRKVNVFFNITPIINAGEQIVGYLGVLVDITKRKRTERALQESEAKYRTLIEQSNDAIYLICHDKFLIINKKFEKIFGYSQDEIRSPDFNILDLVAPKSRALIKERRQKVIEGKELATRYEFTGLSKDDQEIEFEVSVTYINHKGGIAIQGVLRDITERKQMEQALRDGEEHFRSVFEGAMDAIFVEKIEGEILDANRAACNLLGYSHKELVRMHVKDIVPPEIIKQLPEIVKRHKSGKGMFIQEAVNIHKNGRRIPIEVSTNLIKINDKPRVIAIVRDITERKKAEKEKIDAIRQTVTALVRAVELRDPYTPDHSIKVANISEMIARRLGWEEDRILGLRLAAELHDIGKIGVPAEILVKPARLNELEYIIIREHVKKGYDILKDIKFPFPVAKVVYQSHELLDGSGYPQRLKGEQIIMEARILQVADILESFNSNRPYRPPLGMQKAIEKLKRGAGVIFDKDVVRIAFELVNEAGGKPFWE